MGYPEYLREVPGVARIVEHFSATTENFIKKKKKTILLLITQKK